MKINNNIPYMAASKIAFGNNNNKLDKKINNTTNTAKKLNTELAELEESMAKGKVLLSPDQIEALSRLNDRRKASSDQVLNMIKTYGKDPNHIPHSANLATERPPEPEIGTPAINAFIAQMQGLTSDGKPKNNI